MSSTGATFKSFHGAMTSGRSHSNKMPNFPYHSTTALVHAQKLLNLTAITQILALVVSLLHQANRTANSRRNAANSFPSHYPSTELTPPSLCMDTSSHMHHPLYRLYSFPTTSLSDKQCASLNEIIGGPILNKLHINRHFPKKVLYCSHARGGLNFPSFRILQAQQGLLTMIKHFRWNKTIGKDMLSALSSVQLISGLVTPIFEDVTTPLIPPPRMVPTPSKMSDQHDRLTVDRMPMVPRTPMHS